MSTERPPAEESIGALITRVIEDAKAFAQAEIALYKARFAGWIALAKSVAVLAVAALVLLHGAIIALFVGLLLIFQPIVGPGFATLIVVLGALSLAGLFGWLAYARITRRPAAKP